MSLTAVVGGILGGIDDAEGWPFLTARDPYGDQLIYSGVVEVRAAGVRYRQYPITDGRPTRIAHLDQIVPLIKQAAKDGAVLVLCVKGVSRSQATVVAYLDHIGLTTMMRSQLRPGERFQRRIGRKIRREIV